MNVLALVSAITAMVITTVSILTLWVFSAASLANNTSEAAQHQVKLWLLGLSLYAVAGIALGIWLLSIQRAGWATISALLPAVSMTALFLYFVSRP